VQEQARYSVPALRLQRRRARLASQPALTKPAVP